MLKEWKRMLLNRSVLLVAVVLLALNIGLFALTACGDSLEAAEVIEVNTAQDSETYVFGEDYQQNWNNWGSNEAKRFAISENGYYFYCGTESRLIYFHDNVTNETVPLCNQPDCNHSDQNCNAYLSFVPLFLQYYDGNLYAMCSSNSDVVIYRISNDGSTIGQVGTILNIEGAGSFNGIVHRGYAYCAVYSNNASKRTPEVYRLSLSGGEEADQIISLDSCFGGGCVLKAYGNYVYIQVQHYEDGDGNGYSGDLYRYNIHTGETELVLEGVRRDFAVDGQYVYYDNDTQVVAYDLEAHEESVLLDVGYPVYLTYDGTYLYCDNDCGLYIAGHAGEEIDEHRTVTVIDISTHEIAVSIPMGADSDAVWDLIGTTESDWIVYVDDATFYRTNLSALLRGEEVVWEELH